jgi:hypothetical protein
MRTIAAMAGALMLLVHASSAMAQGPDEEGYPPEDPGIGDGAPGYDEGIPPVAPYQEGPREEGASYDEGAPLPDEQPYDEEPYDEEVPSDRAPYVGEADTGVPPYADEDREDYAPPPVRERRRYVDLARGSCGCIRHRPLYGRKRPDTGFRPYSDSGITTSGYVNGYYGTYPEAY